MSESGLAGLKDLQDETQTLSCVAFQGEVQAVALPKLTGTVLRDKVQGTGEEWSGYLGAYFSWLRNSQDLGAHQAWFKALDDMT